MDKVQPCQLRIVLMKRVNSNFGRNTAYKFNFLAQRPNYKFKFWRRPNFC